MSGVGMGRLVLTYVTKGPRELANFVGNRNEMYRSIQVDVVESLLRLQNL